MSDPQLQFCITRFPRIHESNHLLTVAVSLQSQDFVLEGKPAEMKTRLRSTGNDQKNVLLPVINSSLTKHSTANRIVHFPKSKKQLLFSEFTLFPTTRTWTPIPTATAASNHPLSVQSRIKMLMRQISWWHALCVLQPSGGRDVQNKGVIGLTSRSTPVCNQTLTCSSAVTT